jgi:hypothetical protein
LIAPYRLTALLGTALLASSAWAEQSPFYVGVSAAYTQDDNLLRLGNGAVNLAGSRSDAVTTAALLAGFDQHLGRQRGYANLALRDSKYKRNSVYNNQGYTGTAGLDWSTAERVSGSISASANRALANFYSTTSNTQLERNVQNTQGLNASVNVGVVTEYSLFTNLGHRQLKNSASVVSNSDFSQDNGSFGLRWQPRAQTSISLALTTTKGRYPKFGKDASGAFFADQFRQNGVEVAGTLTPSGASSIDGRLGYSKTRYDLNQARGFSGLTGTFGWTWQPTAKLRTITRYSRDTGQNSYAVQLFDPTNGFTDGAQLFSQLVNAFRMQADYEVTAKISLTSSLQYTQRTIANSFADGARQEGKDASTVFQLGMRWQPLRSVSLGCDLSNEQRTASGSGTVALKDNTFGCYGQFQLQQ